ncbi:hypothetical protein P3X46_004531 [Hevea brasiliensis]|uniref:Uncharacterized protein n=1 Tax=Hevea brasiliensis TaxID=3981 RepID=A0ABQ9MYW7_HEVBR|nr:hypothetical protein P3X46_004531 [Hevea brasiliensis]
MDGLENAPRSLHESAVLSSQDSHPSFEAESDSLGRRRLQLRDGKVTGGSTIARMITNTFKQWIDTEGVNWKAVSEETKEFYWKEFKKKCCWESFEEAGIKATWRSKVVVRYKDMQHWNDPKVIQQLEIYSRNRRAAANAHGPSTHIGGSITYAEWFDKLLYMMLYIVARREELTQTTPDNIDKNQLYLDVVGGGEKRRKLEDERQVMIERMDQMKLEKETNMERMRSSMMEEMMRLVRDLPTLLPPPPQN